MGLAANAAVLGMNLDLRWIYETDDRNALLFATVVVERAVQIHEDMARRRDHG